MRSEGLLSLLLSREYTSLFGYSVTLNYSSVKCSLHPAGVKVRSVHWFSSVKELATVVLWYMMVYCKEDVDQSSK